MTIGGLVAFNAYVVLLQALLRLLGFIVMLGQRASASAERIYELLDERVSSRGPSGAVDLIDPRARSTSTT